MINKNSHLKLLKRKKIACIDIKTFLPYGNKAEYIKRFCNMLKSYESYKHLIIDVRGNGGGYTDIWTKYLVSPIIKENSAIDTKIVYKFIYSKNKYFKEYESNFLRQKMEKTGDIENFQFAEQNREDKEFFDSILDYSEGISYGNDDTSFINNFTGKIWLLIDRKSGSVADRLAYFAKGKKGKTKPFATLVGENTGGLGINLSVNRLYLKLPESNMLMQSDMTYGLNPDGSCHDETGYL